ncbi:hypothetical protein [Nonomuraea africana]|uniref:Uncharacterized protein n=1 Tax=Nonomuraea africana TaxID=46171 RepID=A0ABR9KF44_9ACTN|nr:hypothetical protein [Nonomuraea africana]MBE1560605.1 hypothetical protein [Nonomuraea africana]
MNPWQEVVERIEAGENNDLVGAQCVTRRQAVQGGGGTGQRTGRHRRHL